MLGEAASGGSRVGTRFALRPRARLVACFVFALGVHVVVLASRPARGRTIAPRRSAGGLQAIEFMEYAPRLPYPPRVLVATVPPGPAAPRQRNTAMADRTAGVTRAHSHGEPPRSVAFEATSSVVAPSTSGAAPGADRLAFEAGQRSSQDAAVAPRAQAEHGRPQGPRLLTTGVCGGFFPPQARDDDGAVIVALNVHESGTPYAPRVISETPLRQGFGSAALRCASFLKFSPAESAAGAHVPSISVVRLRFARARAK